MQKFILLLVLLTFGFVQTGHTAFEPSQSELREMRIASELMTVMAECSYYYDDNNDLHYLDDKIDLNDIQLDFYGDVNGDKIPEAMVFAKLKYYACYGESSGNYYSFLTKKDGYWQKIDESPNEMTFLKTKGVDDYPDIVYDAPGFCFTVGRYNGVSYEVHREVCKSESE